jgi:DNA-binding response OmpR family regulator
MSAPRLLLVEDDPELLRMLSSLLSEEGYRVTTGNDGQQGLHLGLTHPFDVMVLDRGLPGVEGLDLLMRLRRRGVTAPALVLSARSAVNDRVAGLDAGAEDYLTKPFEIPELLARIRALLRRNTSAARVLSLGRRVLDLDALLVTDPSQPATPSIRLSEREAQLLAVLARRPERVFTRAELLDRVFIDAESDVAVDTYVHYCRRKMGRGVIRTVRGRGYQLGTA